MHHVHTEGLSIKDKRQLWIEIVAEYEQCADITQRQFCEERGIKYDHFAYYHGRHKKKSHQQTVSALPPSLKFIPIQTIKENTASDIMSVFYHEFEIRLPVLFEETHLLRVLTVLRKISC